jgi:hypothetical protein
VKGRKTVVKIGTIRLQGVEGGLEITECMEAVSTTAELRIGTCRISIQPRAAAREDFPVQTIGLAKDSKAIQFATRNSSHSSTTRGCTQQKK